MRKVLIFFTICILLIILLLASVSIPGKGEFQSNISESKYFNSFIMSYRIDKNSFIIKKDTFKINEIWVSYAVYATGIRWITNIDKEEVYLNLNIENSRLFIENYMDWNYKDTSGYVFKVEVDSNNFYFKGIRGTIRNSNLMCSLNKTKLKKIIENERIYLVLCKEDEIIERFELNKSNSN